MNHKFPTTLTLGLLVPLILQAIFRIADPMISRGSSGLDGFPPASIQAFNSPPPGVLFQDDFETSGASQWTTHGSGTWAVRYDGFQHGGVYEVNMGSGGYLLGWSTAGETSWTNYMVEFDVKGVSGAPNLLFGVRYSDTLYSGYTFIIRTDLDQVYLVDDINFANCYPNCPILTYVPFNSSLQTWYHIEIKVIGPRLELSIDDDKVIEYTLQNPYRTNGKIALTGWTGATETHIVRFDNVVVYSPYDLYLPMTFNFTPARAAPFKADPLTMPR